MTSREDPQRARFSAHSAETTSRFRNLEDVACSAFGKCVRHFRDLKKLGLITDADISEAIQTGRASTFIRNYQLWKIEALLRRPSGQRRGPVTLDEILVIKREQE